MTGHTNLISSMVLLKNENLATVSNDSTIKIWNPEAGDLMKTIYLNRVTVLPNGFLVSSLNNTISIWNTDTWTLR